MGPYERMFTFIEMRIIGSKGVPSDAEIMLQLSRMLEHKLFLGAPSRLKVLKFVVEQALDDKEISEDIIGYSLFANYVADESDDVRVTARNLRRSLDEYYRGDGAYDLVRIGLPPGPRYPLLHAFGRWNVRFV